MDDKDWFQFQLGAQGIQTGSMMNQVGLDHQWKPPKLPPIKKPEPKNTNTYGPTPSSVRQVKPRKLTRRELRQRERERARLERDRAHREWVAGLASTVKFHAWKARLERLLSRVRKSLLRLILLCIAGVAIGLLTSANLGKGPWAEIINVSLWIAFYTAIFALYVLYFIKGVAMHVPSAIRTWSGMGERGIIATPFQFGFFLVKVAFVIAILAAPPIVILVVANASGLI
ncbi:hypothetical protein [Ruegeria arenilitoris]|uniref:hypothetical protein n=1 Tax=Ruegeria arenilitoris TaxID=1173585 RepID=UPI00147C1264|nr:hypothetical protein [Ruegeria arenilitoris]